MHRRDLSLDFIIRLRTLEKKIDMNYRKNKNKIGLGSSPGDTNSVRPEQGKPLLLDLLSSFFDSEGSWTSSHKTLEGVSSTEFLLPRQTFFSPLSLSNSKRPFGNDGYELSFRLTR